MSTRKIDPEAVRRRVVEATVGCLVEHGYAGTTTQRVQVQAGVSRGALLHHFPSKPVMFLAAVQHVGEQQDVAIRAAAERRVSGSDRLEFAFDVLHDAMSGPLYLAGYELWMAARTDDDLRSVLTPYERKVGQNLRELGVLIFGPEFSTQPGFPTAFDALVQVFRGLALTGVLRENLDRENELMAAWRSVFPAMCSLTQP
ncbi:TetR/AcrR family transcriptional regulator [Rhodococcus sp. H36-A4]|uniref:TetR/AcrR family transcriptional regulator n=1 Tax=Rhodococcus sp. H36-A4 TaxID=3004353 RepID=UPI0022AFD7BF|nr:TetR/AcrR family transcriptional regulator [Rhodococcus sp. H36-A4]MCZ4076851.1 TetR/AcrR family transcriptional regulator [Rhodococcus sp. H36-A4]